MNTLPASNLRTNVATWAVPCALLPAVGQLLPGLAPKEAFDPSFRGQDLETTYFDTLALDLRRARARGDRYLTLRLRCYAGNDETGEVYALSAKTESGKWRQEVGPAVAEALLASPGSVVNYLPADLRARFLDLLGGGNLDQAARVCCRRYAVEDETDRYTLDVDVRTDAGKCLPYAVLEHKSGDPGAPPDRRVTALAVRAIKLSKFLWATAP
jgi:hypothetical protein